ncbi:shikimate kinase AroK [Sedimenticola sp.]|uniref:shikimate kinase AroK n=1 Tax=Sedimenticola sp. TaxID=1940285 RepID=UPI003D0B8A2D
MNHPNNIFLIGPMGAGKSTIGRQVASLLGLDFDDTDHEIQRRTGVDIPTIFDYEGEEGFRKRESAVIDDLTQRGSLVLATGGGSILNPDNRRNLSSRGFVVYLYCSPEQQYERTLRDRSRPLLQTKNPLGTLQALMEERDPLYRETADIIVTSEKRSATAVANEIVRKLRAE